MDSYTYYATHFEYKQVDEDLEISELEDEEYEDDYQEEY